MKIDEFISDQILELSSVVAVEGKYLSDVELASLHAKIEVLKDLMDFIEKGVLQ